MRELTQLHTWILSSLSGQNNPVTRYEIMQTLNYAAAFVDTPYSPGATYHAIKQLLQRGLIKINQDKISISPLGKEALLAELTNSNPFQSVSKNLARILQIQVVRDAPLRAKAMKKIQVEMINFSQKTTEVGHLSGDDVKAINICRSEMSKALQRIVSELSA